MTRNHLQLTRTLFLAALLALVATPALADDEDPWRRMNEGTHEFNEGFDRYFFEPVSKGWDWVMPQVVQDGVGNFFENLLVPRTILNDVLQGEIGSSLKHSGRFVVNTTLGIGGLIDVAGATGIDHDPEDFGQTLGVWGVGSGPYLVLPFLGPSTLRDTTALPLDYAANPAFWVDEGVVTGSATAIDLTNRRAGALEEIAENRASSVNFYVFVRDAYLQNREKNVQDGEVVQDDDLYYDTDDLE